MSGQVETLPFVTRLWFAFVCSLRVLLDGRFAGRVWAVKDAMPQLRAAEAEKPSKRDRAPDSAPPERQSDPPKSDGGDDAVPDSAKEAPSVGLSPALVLLSLLQREGRLVDFLEQEITGFDDAEIGAAVRVVHEGCRKVLHSHAEVLPVRQEEEESRVEVTDGVDTGAVKLTGKLSGDPPYRGILRHRGWRIESLTLPTPIAGHDANVIAPAEVEL